MICGVMTIGQGDKKQAYAPSYAPVLCNVTGKMFSPCCMRECKEPHVVERYGIGGKAMVSIYVCQKCKYKVTTPYCGALGCGYGLEQRVQEGE